MAKQEIPRTKPEKITNVDISRWAAEGACVGLCLVALVVIIFISGTMIYEAFNG